MIIRWQAQYQFKQSQMDIKKKKYDWDTIGKTVVFVFHVAQPAS